MRAIDRDAVRSTFLWRDWQRHLSRERMAMTIESMLGFARRQFVEVTLTGGDTHWLPADQTRSEVILCWGDDDTIHLFNPADLFHADWNPLQWLTVEVRDAYGRLRYRFRRDEVQRVEPLVLHVAAA
jgi:hypothetical protein